MAISESHKQQIVRDLLVTKQKAHALETSLRFKGQNTEADQVSAKAGKLSGEIDRLLGQMMAGWVGQATKIAAEIGKANASLESSIGEIQKGVEIAENIVKAIGYIDDLVVIASKIAAAL